FLANQKQDYAQAEVMYQRAVEADPKNANLLGIYANFMATYKSDLEQADQLFNKAIQTAPEHPNILGNYAKFLFATDQKDKARQCLEKAESQPDLEPDLQVELAFYRYAHCQPYALAPLKQQLQSGSRSIGWDLTDNVQVACADLHPHPKLLTAIAQVISGEQDIATLDQYPEWTETP
ncbi:Tetratricopeptide repeat-containing protein, partial [Thiothrix eikelboomii]